MLIFSVRLNVRVTICHLVLNRVKVYSYTSLRNIQATLARSFMKPTLASAARRRISWLNSGHKLMWFRLVKFPQQITFFSSFSVADGDTPRMSYSLVSTTLAMVFRLMFLRRGGGGQREGAGAAAARIALFGRFLNFRKTPGSSRTLLPPSDQLIAWQNNKHQRREGAAEYGEKIVSKDMEFVHNYFNMYGVKSASV